VVEEDTIDSRDLVPAIGDKISLDRFDLGPTIAVPEECWEYVARPTRVADVGMLTVLTSLHEFVPERPGEHGILYLDKNNIPRYIVWPLIT
jgi:hypothetical protein